MKPTKLIAMIVLACLTLAVSPARAAIALIASTSAGSANKNNVTTTGIDTTGAKLIVVAVTGAGNVDQIVLTDSNSNTWIPVTALTAPTYTRAQLYYCINPIVGAGHTFTGTRTTSWPVVSVAAYSVTGSVQLESVSDGAQTISTVTSQQPGSLTPSINGALLATAESTVVATSIAINSSFSKASTDLGSNNFGGGLGWLVQATAAAVNPTWSWSGASRGSTVMACFVEITAPNLTVTDKSDGTVLQRTKGTTAKTVSFAGGYANHTPTTIEIKIVNHSGGATVQDWTALTSPTISGGAWSGTVSIPQGGWYNVLARSKDSGGLVQETSPQSKARWGVGIIVGMIGQSNMQNMKSLQSSPPTANQGSRQWDSCWTIPFANGGMRFSSVLQSSAGLTGIDR